MRTLALTFLTLAAFVISACTEESMQVAGGGGVSTGKTSAERALEQEVRSLNQVSRDIVVRNAVQGAAAGAAVGCGLGLLLGGDAEDCLKYAAAGGVVGAAGGAAVGQRAASANRELVQQDATIAKLRGVNQQLTSVRANLSSVVRSQNAEIASLQRQLANQQISKSAYNARVRSINSNRTAVINGLARSEQSVAKERAQLVSLEQQSGYSLAQSKNAASSTQRRLEATRNSISLVSTI